MKKQSFQPITHQKEQSICRNIMKYCGVVSDISWVEAVFIMSKPIELPNKTDVIEIIRTVRNRPRIYSDEVPMPTRNWLETRRIYGKAAMDLRADLN